MSDILHEILACAAALWRKRWYVAAIGWGVCAPGWIGVLELPDRYESSARIYVDTDSLLSSVLRGISPEPDIGQQVDIMQRTLLSRPNIERLASSAELDRGIETDVARAALYQDLARRVQVKQN